MSLIRALVGPWCEGRPMDAVHLQAWLAAIEADVARGDQKSGIEHFRDAIQFVCDCDAAMKEASRLEKPKGK